MYRVTIRKEQIARMKSKHLIPYDVSGILFDENTEHKSETELPFSNNGFLLVEKIEETHGGNSETEV